MVTFNYSVLFIFVSIWILSLYITECFHVPGLYNNEHQEFTDVDVIKRLNSHKRHQRSSDVFPDRLDAIFSAAGRPVKLKLTRHYSINVNGPVFVSRNGKIVRELLPDTEAVLYQDVKNNCAMMVEIDQNSTTDRRLNLFGTFALESDHYLIQKHDTSNSHVVTRTNITLPYIDTPLHPEKNTYRQFNTKKTRRKRQTQSYHVEVLLVTDYKIYSTWLSVSDKTTAAARAIDAKARIRQFYAFTLLGIDIRYQSIAGVGYTIKPVWAGLIIADSKSTAPWTEDRLDTTSTPFSVDGSNVLDAFRDWTRVTDLPSNDHAMVFTGYNVKSGAGIAYTDALCGTSSVSLVEDQSSLIATTIAAHELGHSLGADHDGTGNTCNSADDYVMASTNVVQASWSTNRNLFLFSSCSITSMTSYINRLNRQNSNCMTSFGSDYDASAISEYENQVFGQVYTADMQCEYSQGAGSYVCRGQYDSNYDNFCAGMYCRLPGTNTCSLGLPAEGTTCGNGKWCEKGFCVFSSSAPKVSDKCPFGDVPGIINGNETCAQLIARSTEQCYYGFGEDCCATCESKHTGITGCEYGDKSASCAGISGQSCYIGSNADICCQSCRELETYIPGCKYGDKLRGCQKDSCPFYTQSTRESCCETCYDGTTTTPSTTVVTTTTTSTVTPTQTESTGTPSQTPTTTTKSTVTVKSSTTSEIKTTTSGGTPPTVKSSTTSEIKTTASGVTSSTVKSSTIREIKTTVEMTTASAPISIDTVVIVVGVIVGVILVIVVVVIVVCLLKRRQQKSGLPGPLSRGADNSAYNGVVSVMQPPRPEMPHRHPPKPTMPVRHQPLQPSSNTDTPPPYTLPIHPPDTRPQTQPPTKPVIPSRPPLKPVPLPKPKPPSSEKRAIGSEVNHSAPTPPVFKNNANQQRNNAHVPKSVVAKEKEESNSSGLSTQPLFTRVLPTPPKPGNKSKSNRDTNEPKETDKASTGNAETSKSARVPPKKPPPRANKLPIYGNTKPNAFARNPLHSQLAIIGKSNPAFEIDGNNFTSSESSPV